MGKEKKGAVELDKIGRLATPILTFEDIKDDVDKLINKNSKEYAKMFEDARKQSVKLFVDEWVKENPKAEKESVEEYKERVNQIAKDYLEQTPTEFLRTMRMFCTLGTTIYNRLAFIDANFRDFIELYQATHEEELSAYAIRHKDEILKQQEELRKQQEKQNK